jgi:RNA polymerase sigma factor (TIGR02999 family)
LAKSRDIRLFVKAVEASRIFTDFFSAPEVCPMTAGAGDITVLLRRARDPHDSEARQQLFLRVEQELRGIAATRRRRLSPGDTLPTTALIDDAFMRLVDHRRLEWEGRGQFFRIASGVMRRIVAEQVRQSLRRRRPTPRGPDHEARLIEDRCPAPVERLQEQEMLQALLEALGRLEQEDADAAAVFELRFFGGHCLVLGATPGEFAIPDPGKELLPFREVAALLGIPRATAFAHWSRAVQRLQAELHGFAPPNFQDHDDDH